MQIVIDKESLTTLFTVAFYAICGGDYSDVKNTVIELLDKVGYTLLPKGHGRLMILSEDALKENLIDVDFSCQKWISEVDLSNTTVAIIEADKGEKE